SMSRARFALFSIIPLALAAAFVGPGTSQSQSQTPKSGGVLNMMLREELSQGFSIHETSTISTVWPAMPCLNNLVLFDPLKKTESVDTIIGELAEKWSWQDNYRNLVFFLRKGVKWHDGQPFTSKDVEFVKNPDYFVKGRPHLDGLKYFVIVERGTRQAAIQAGKLDVSFPGETTKTAAEQLKKAVPQLVITPFSQNVADNIIMNIKKPPFDNLKVRLAVSHAIDRRALIQAVHQGGAVVGAALAPKPWGFWGLAEKDLLGLPGYGAKAAEEKALARKLVAEAG